MHLVEWIAIGGMTLLIILLALLFLIMVVGESADE